MKTFVRTFFIAFGTLTILAAVFIIGYMARDFWGGNQSFDILKEAYQILLENGLNEPPSAPALEYGMIHGMVGAYGDPYTIFNEPPQHELQSAQLEGKFGGIGAELSRDADGNYVIFPFPDSPASRAGIQEGDRLLAVDGIEVTEQTTIEEVQSSIRGPVGKKVTLSIGRAPDFSPQNILIKREEFPLPSVSWRLDLEEPQTGILKVNLIAATTPAEIEAAVKDLQARGATHFVLDLRDNPGGLLSAGVDIARLFLEKGDVVMQQQYRDRDIETFEVERPGPLKDLPLVVLINHGSASAAEITAGALQLHRHAPLVGSPSFGKDTIQLVFVLQDDSSLRVTSARWWIPGLEPPIGESGLQPDYPVAPGDDPNVDMTLKAAIEILFAH
jgi:carboxyl-terminal processing protease